MTQDIYKIISNHHFTDMDKAEMIRDLILKDLVLEEYGRWRNTEHFAAAGACANMTAKLMGVKSKPPLSNEDTQKIKEWFNQ